MNVMKINNLYILNNLLKINESEINDSDDISDYYPDKFLDGMEYYSYRNVSKKIGGEKIGFVPKGFLAKLYCKKKLTPKDTFEYYDIESGDFLESGEYYDISQMGFKFYPIGVMSDDDEQLLLICRRKISLNSIITIIISCLILGYIYFIK